MNGWWSYEQKYEFLVTGWVPSYLPFEITKTTACSSNVAEHIPTTGPTVQSSIPANAAQGHI